MNKMHLLKWEPIPGLPQKVYVESVKDDYDGFRILLREDGGSERTIKITFEMPIVYRKVDEGDRLKTSSDFHFVEDWSFFIVKNSDLITWVVEEAFETQKKKMLTHFLIAAANDFIDVVSSDPPSFDWGE